MKINENVKIGDKNITFKDLIDCKDYTSQCSFMNCTLQKGKIMKMGRLAIVQIAILPTVTSDWISFCRVPTNFYPVGVNAGGIPLSRDNDWIYGSEASGREGYIQGSIESGNVKNIVGIYLCEESD